VKGSRTYFFDVTTREFESSATRSSSSVYEMEDPFDTEYVQIPYPIPKWIQTASERGGEKENDQDLYMMKIWKTRID
jgi:hypothetical protein